MKYIRLKPNCRLLLASGKEIYNDTHYDMQVPADRAGMDKFAEDLTADRAVRSMSRLLSRLANSLCCPACKKIFQKPFYNLGEKFNWAEGCESCHRVYNS